jgi:hypothetical protein
MQFISELEGNKDTRISNALFVTLHKAYLLCLHFRLSQKERLLTQTSVTHMAMNNRRLAS